MDRRERDHKWYESFDEKRMVFITHDGTEVPATFEVCGTCDGKGKHVNPSIDSHGISAEEFAEDPDFRESYFRGDYDVPCNECHGNRVSPEPDWNRMPAELKKQIESDIDEFYDYQRVCEAERRMGC